MKLFLNTTRVEKQEGLHKRQTYCLAFHTTFRAVLNRSTKMDLSRVYSTDLTWLSSCLAHVQRFSSSIICLLSTVSGLFWVEPAASAPSLFPGDSGESVIELQKALSQEGSYPGPLDGYYGEATEQAVIKFQSKNSLLVDGIAGEQTQAALQNRLLPLLRPVPPPTSLGVGFGISEILGLIAFSGVAASVIFRSDASKQSVHEPFNIQAKLYFNKKYLEDLGFFDLNTQVKISFLHKETAFSASYAISAKDKIVMADSDFPRGDYTFVVEGIYEGKKVTKEGSFRL